MTEGQTPAVNAAGALRVDRGAALIGKGNKRIGTVDAVFADYLLVRTAGLMPVDLYVPQPEVSSRNGGVAVDCDADEAYERWHRPLKRAPHD